MFGVAVPAVLLALLLLSKVSFSSPKAFNMFVHKEVTSEFSESSLAQVEAQSVELISRSQVHKQMKSGLSD